MHTPFLETAGARDLEPSPFAALAAAPRGEPLALLHGCGAGPVRLCRDAVDSLVIPSGSWRGALDRLEAFLARHGDRLTVGWLGYDLRDDVEELERSIAEDRPGVPVLAWWAFDTVEEWPAQPVPAAPPAPQRTQLRAHFRREEYEAQVARVVEAIRAGDIFQANLTQPFTGAYGGDPRELFWRLCAESPAPFACYLETADGTAVLSSSPEEFLWRDGRRLRSRPIKGTRPRDADPETDRALLRELLHSEKDQAELAMIVDLMRNDLGKVATAGSVRVGSFPEHASYAQVHHLYTTVEATLREGVGPAELLRATFPPGSITGAPKLRCMEVLEELERVRRGVYTGAIGWIGPGPALHLNVAIRTMVLHDGLVRIGVGGGVTADSDPAAEYQETLHKAAGMLRALNGEVVEP